MKEAPKRPRIGGQVQLPKYAAPQEVSTVMDPLHTGGLLMPHMAASPPRPMLPHAAPPPGHPLGIHPPAPPPGPPPGHPPGIHPPAMPMHNVRPPPLQGHDDDDDAQYALDVQESAARLLDAAQNRTPQHARLVALKTELAAMAATPPLWLQADVRTLPLSPATFGTKFDVILIDPHVQGNGGHTAHTEGRAPLLGAAEQAPWTWDQVRALGIDTLADTPSFVFLWCGSGRTRAVEQGRECLKSWGFRVVDSIAWVKSQRLMEWDGGDAYGKDIRVMVSAKEVCLVGVRGNVRRTQDGHLVHPNIDADVLVADEPPGEHAKPHELYGIIERLVLGRRRIELFGTQHNVRPGWVTVGAALPPSNFNPQLYAANFINPNGMPCVGHDGTKPVPGSVSLVGTIPEVEALRPRGDQSAKPT